MGSITTAKQRGGCTGKGFQPGESGNPGGRPKGLASLKGELRDRLGELEPSERQTWAQKLVESLLWKAAKGDVQAIRLVFEYVDGKPTNAVQEVTLNAPPDSDLATRLIEYENEFRKLKEGIIATPEARRLAGDLLAEIQSGPPSGTPIPR